MRAPRLLALAALTSAGCYAPSVPSAGYRCGADQACPSDLQCVCGACVTDPAAAACSFTLDIPAGGCPPSDSDALCVTEGQPFPGTVTAFSDSARLSPSSYSGSASFASTWGSARATAPFTFQNGVAHVSLTLDRATPKHKIYVTVLSGTAAGASGTGIYVDPPAYAVEPAPVIKPPFGWARTDVGLPAIDRAPDGSYTMYFAGLADTLIAVGSATSPDGNAWTPGPVPLFNPPPGTGYFSPSVLRFSNGGVRLFFSSQAGGGAPVRLLTSYSSDGGKTWTDPRMLPNLCAACGGGTQLPWALRSPTIPDEWLLFFTGVFGGSKGPNIGVARTVDGGMDWTADEVPPPKGDAAGAARVLWDARSGLYRMWYAQAPGLDPCQLQISYATSTDGQFWTGTRPSVPPLTVDQVPWAKAVGPGLLPGAIEPPDPSSPSPHYTLWYSAWVHFGLTCLPAGIGRATRP